MKHTMFVPISVQKQIAVMLIATILMWAVGLPMLLNYAEAAQLTNVSDTLSDSDKGVVANHTIRFAPTVAIPGTGTETIVITFPAGFTVATSSVFTDVDVSVGGSDVAVAAAQSGATWGVVINNVARTFTFTVGTGGVATSSQVVVEIGTNATFGGNGVYQITNPDPVTAEGVGTSYEITIVNGTRNVGATRVAIIDDVTMTAAVETTLTFNIYGVASSTSINGVSTYASSTATSMAFGSLAPDVPKVLGQRLTVATNAKNGFAVTIVQDQNLLSASNADFDLFVDGDATSTPKAWQDPGEEILDENTWGHYGITSADFELSGYLDPFGAVATTSLFAGDFASTTPLEIFWHDGPSDASTNGEGQTSVAIKIQASPLQEAANDYTNTLTYVCTPVF